MYTVSETLRTAINNGTPQRVLLEFTDANAVFSNEDIVVSAGVELDEMFNSDTDLTIGLCPSAEIRFDMLNDEGQLADFTFGKFKAWLGARIDSGTSPATAKTKTFTGGEYPGLYEFTPLGVFIADRPNVVKKKILSITANDQMCLFDVDMPELSYPIKLSAMFEAICNAAHVSYKSSTFVNSGFVVSEMPDQFEGATMRDVLQWIAEMACSTLRFDRDGVLEFTWFNPVNSAYDEHSYSDFSPAWFEIKAIDGLRVRNSSSSIETSVGSTGNVYLLQNNPFLRIPDPEEDDPYEDDPGYVEGDAEG